MVFEDRFDAGRKLAEKLLKFSFDNPFVLALPRGGVPVGYEIAKVLHAPLNVIIARKIGLLSNPEFGIGAIAEGGVKILDKTTIKRLEIDPKELKEIIVFEEKELERRIKIYREGLHLPELEGKNVLLVDDGMATGITAKAAVKAVKKLNPKNISLISPVCSQDAVKGLRSKTKETICLTVSSSFTSVGVWYKNFAQLSDQDVVNILKESRI